MSFAIDVVKSGNSAVVLTGMRIDSTYVQANSWIAKTATNQMFDGTEMKRLLKW